MPGTESTWYGVETDEGNTAVTEINMSSNNLTGSIPKELGSLTNLKYLDLDNNKLSGSIPKELGSLENLMELEVSGNSLVGTIPPELGNLTKLTSTDIGYNALYTYDIPLSTFLDDKDPGWENTQTVAPGYVTARSLSSASVEVSWLPIYYKADSGGYRVFWRKIHTGTYTLFDTTEDKWASQVEISGLTSNTTYYIVVQTRTESHDGNQNTVDSEYSEEVVATTGGDGDTGGGGGGCFISAISGN